MARLRISTSMNMHEGSMDNIPEHISKGLFFHKEMGFDAVDMPAPVLIGMGEHWKEGIAHALSESEKAGIRFELCHLPFRTKPFINQEEEDAFDISVHRAIDAAKMLGVSYAVLHPYTFSTPLSEYDEKAQYESVMAHLTPYAAHAAKAGLNIVVENLLCLPGAVPSHRFCGEPKELCRVADEFGIGVCWDFGHANINGLVQSEALKYVGKRVKMLHVNDNHVRRDAHVPPFLGEIDWKDAMKGLAGIGYQGLFNYEVKAQKVPAIAREDFARYMVKTAHALLDLMECE